MEVPKNINDTVALIFLGRYASWPGSASSGALLEGALFFAALFFLARGQNGNPKAASPFRRHQVPQSAHVDWGLWFLFQKELTPPTRLRIVQAMRKLESCLNCGEEREIAAHGLCFKCYRQVERTASNPARSVDRHAGAIRKEHQKLFTAYSQTITGLGKLGLSKADLHAVIQVMRPYLEPISDYLRDSGATGAVSNEPNAGVLFTVHKPASSPPLPTPVTQTDEQEQPELMTLC